MSQLTSLTRCIQTLKKGYTICKRIKFPRLPVSATCGAPYTLHRHLSSATQNEQDAARRKFLAETYASARHKRSPKEKASLVIFDKDGTLICFHTMWSTWAVQVTESIAKQVGLDIENKLYATLGVCAKSKRVFPGLLAEQTTAVIQEELVKVLVSEGVPKEKAREAVVQSWKEGDTGIDNSVKSIHPDLRTLFKILKAEGIKVAICTADNRRGTMNTLRNLGLDQYVDMVVCGDDPFTQPKPSPHNAWKICGALGVDPQKAVMVGDTKADVGMGHAARLGWVVGVLSGVGDTLDLQPHANYVIENVKDLLPLILPYEDWTNYYTYISDARVLREPADTQTCETAAAKTRIDIQNYNLIIFDLHGTLVCINNKYGAWLEKLINRLESTTGLKLASKICQHLGVSMETKKIERGILEKGAQAQLKDAVVDLLRKEGFHYEEALITVNQVWKDCEQVLKTASVVPLDRDVQMLFQTLKKSGMKIAVNTSENREIAVSNLKAVGLTSYVDMLVCGDDPMSRYRPDAHNALLICEEMGTTPDKTVVVGDTMEDIGMGLNAKVGLTIGVLTDVATDSELVQADHIVSKISEILDHLSVKETE